MSIPFFVRSLVLTKSLLIRYIILQGLTGTASGFLTIGPLIVYYVKLILLGSTPRSVFGIKYTGRSVEWGTLWPNTTLLVVISKHLQRTISSTKSIKSCSIALSYSVIAPIINGLACSAFFLFYMLYKYLFIWQLEQPRSGETGGLFYPKAMQHVLVGLYLQQICLAALFFLAQTQDKKSVAIAEGVLMIILIVVTV